MRESVLIRMIAMILIKMINWYFCFSFSDDDDKENIHYKSYK